MYVDTLINELDEICIKGQIGASRNRIRKIRKLVDAFRQEREYPWYMKLALWFYERK